MILILVPMPPNYTAFPGSDSAISARAEARSAKFGWHSLLLSSSSLVELILNATDLKYSP